MGFLGKLAQETNGMNDIKTTQQALVNAIRHSSVYNPNTQLAPACILWPDKERQWGSVIPSLQAAMPELLVLGEYEPASRSGPAIWLKCVIANTLDDEEVPENLTPIVYSVKGDRPRFTNWH